MKTKNRKRVLVLAVLLMVLLAVTVAQAATPFGFPGDTITWTSGTYSFIWTWYDFTVWACNIGGPAIIDGGYVTFDTDGYIPTPQRIYHVGWDGGSCHAFRTYFQPTKVGVWRQSGFLFGEPPWPETTKNINVLYVLVPMITNAIAP